MELFTNNFQNFHGDQQHLIHKAQKQEVDVQTEKKYFFHNMRGPRHNTELIDKVKCSEVEDHLQREQNKLNH